MEQAMLISADYGGRHNESEAERNRDLRKEKRQTKKKKSSNKSVPSQNKVVSALVSQVEDSEMRGDDKKTKMQKSRIFGLLDTEEPRSFHQELDSEIVLRLKSCRCVATCLLADDNVFNLIPLETMLNEYMKIKVLKAANGLEALEIFTEDRTKQCCKKYIQLVLMDINMPIMDGYVAATRILELCEDLG